MIERSVPLTKLSFRRDVRLFLSLLVGFLVVLIVALLLLLQGFALTAYEAVLMSWQAAGDVAARELTAPGVIDNSSMIETSLTRLRSRHGIAGARVARRGHPEIVAGIPEATPGMQSITRQISEGTITLVFDASELAGIRRTVRTISVISMTATAAGVLLLLFYLPRITRPIESMLESAAEVRVRTPGMDEQQYLIETFRSTIDTMRQQEAELLRLHDAQKSRADELERVTAALTRSLVSGFVAFDPSGKIVDLNAAAREILRPAGEAVGVMPREAFGASEFTSSLEAAMESRAALSRAELTHDREGEQRVVGLTTVPLTGEQQQFLGLLAIFTDLTEMRRLESSVREMQNLADLGEISAGIAHEFRNSLAAILGYLRLSKRNSGEHSTSAVERAEKEASTLATAVDGLLAFARPMKLDKSPVDLCALVCDVAEKVAQQSERVSIHCEGDPAVIAGDAALLGRMIENLVRNAAESVLLSGKEGAVSITVTAGATVRVLIRDEGVGIDAADIPRLLLPFQSDKPGGYGLGLPLARKIALLHGGSLTLQGQRGGGAVAVVEIPLDAARGPGR